MLRLLVVLAFLIPSTAFALTDLQPSFEGVQTGGDEEGSGEENPCSAPAGDENPCSAPSGDENPCSAPTGDDNPCAGGEAEAPDPRAGAAKPGSGEKVLQHLRLSAAAGAGRQREKETGTNGYFTADAKVELMFRLGFRLGFEFRDNLYRHTYLSVNAPLSGDGPLAPTDVSEQFLDAQVVVSFNPLFSKTDVAALHLKIAPQLHAFYNGPFRFVGFAIGGGLQLELNPIEQLSIIGGGMYGFNAVGTKSTLSALGKPLHIADFNAGVAWHFPTDKKMSWSLEMRWQSHSIWLEHATRVYHGALLGLAVELL